MRTEPLRIAVINPNSNPVYTEHISGSLEAYRLPGRVEIECLTLDDAPLAIESDADVQGVIAPLCGLVAELESSVDGFVIACFADPGLDEARAGTERPVVGCCEAGCKAAVRRGRRIGLISTGDDIDADRELVLGYHSDIEFLAIESPRIPTADIPTDPSGLRKMARCAQALEEQHVHAIVLGCAGMCSYTKRLRSVVSVPVVEPTAAAVDQLLHTLKETKDDAEDRSTAIA